MRYYKCQVINNNNEKISYYHNKKTSYDLIINNTRIPVKIFYSIDLQHDVVCISRIYDDFKFTNSSEKLYRDVKKHVGNIRIINEINSPDLKGIFKTSKKCEYDYNEIYFKFRNPIEELTKDILLVEYSNLSLTPSIPPSDIKVVGLDIKFTLSQREEICISIRKGVDCTFIEVNGLDDISINELLSISELNEFKHEPNINIYKKLIERIQKYLKINI